MKFLNRRRAAEFLTGITDLSITDQRLADLASKGQGPEYGVINGRAVYTEENLTAWVSAQLSKPVRARRTREGMVGRVA